MTEDEGQTKLSRRRLVQGGIAMLGLSHSAFAMSKRDRPVALYAGKALGRYGFPAGHPFNAERQGAFLQSAQAQDLLERVDLRTGRQATKSELRRFHSAAYLAHVEQADLVGGGPLDGGDTPAFRGVYAAASRVVGSALAGLERILAGDAVHTFQPIGGLHHAFPDRASGFCVFNDVGVLLATLRELHQLSRVAYVDIDAHHGDGVFYAFESDPGVIIADVHQNGRSLFPGTGLSSETGRAEAMGTKLNIELPPRAGDAEFMAAWPRVEAHLAGFKPQFIVLQCGADGLAGDPLTNLRYSEAVHTHVTRRLCLLADEFASGRLMAFGGGGYDSDNLGRAWSTVLRELLV